MRCQNLISCLVLSSYVAAAGIDKSHIGIEPISDEDNLPTPNHMKKPLDPYNEKLSTVDTQAIDSDVDENEETSPGSYNSLWMAISMIAVSEIGDKTFLIAALMAMKHSRLVVFSAAFSSLAVMTILSGVVGHALPTLISQRVTQFLASILFLVFGAKLLKEGLEMSKDAGVEEELAEVEEEIASSNLNHTLDIESGMSDNSSQQSGTLSQILDNLGNLAAFVFSPTWIQVFVMTFLGEWGDRSQIATIAMAAGSDYWFVILGATIGHGFCTAGAVLGGKLLAKRISLRTVTIGGSIAFFIFAVLYFYDAMYGAEAI